MSEDVDECVSEDVDVDVEECVRMKSVWGAWSHAHTHTQTNVKVDTHTQTSIDNTKIDRQMDRHRQA